MDTIGWAFTTSSKYSVKSDYLVTHNWGFYKKPTFHGPNVISLLSQLWKIHDLSKLKTKF